METESFSKSEKNIKQNKLINYIDLVPVKLLENLSYKNKIHKKGSIIWLPRKYAKELEKLDAVVIMVD